ncbi:hypothetical protein [Pseudobacteriovorax antillogorgiicola]|uniref:Glutathione synthase n=1 Tax=Pseudobacteriovorax antillogorgiicola TaxID=1513793 RepID=A0A1Y6B5C4_9BACT|nr:hypothetical protein [Pseudobacteriovorax antillogorgiicola]TCS59222.1 glutathione synthase [Pseudobacteriovorax antillogorgiicola]SME90386.1 glutathione synthase [Pseudobacteriovorax antillogorgiicola]
MAQHKHLFVMDLVENLNLKLDSSLRLAQALLSEGHQCFMTNPKAMSMLHTKGQSQPVCNAIELLPSHQETPELGGESRLFLKDCDAIHMRKDPPFNMDYIACTWLLSEAAKSARVFNDPERLRSLNEKLIIFEFPRYCHDGIVSSQSQEIVDFIQNHAESDGILKPLDLYGGRGVVRLNINKIGLEKARNLVSDETQEGEHMRLVQPFNKAIFEGEVRAFTCCGEPISWCLKVPAKGEYLANTRTGATLEPYTPTESELAMVTEVSGRLAEMGIQMVGYDIIGGVISEINITSPRLLLPEGVDPRPSYSRMAQLIEQNLLP